MPRYLPESNKETIEPPSMEEVISSEQELKRELPTDVYVGVPSPSLYTRSQENLNSSAPKFDAPSLPVQRKERL
jgi:hypothetical protein